VFNWTWTYRRESEIYFPFTNRVPSEMGPVRRILDPTQSNVGWMAMNCHSHSKREAIIKKLMSFIKIDALGSCMHNRDKIVLNGTEEVEPVHIGYHSSSRGPHLAHRVRQQYPFYLSFENSNCHDYVTEKYFGALEAGAIPVVLTGAYYDDISPIRGKSILRASDFPSAEALAAEINRIASNKTLLDEYLAWRSLPRSQLNPSYARLGSEESLGACRLCELLHMDPPPPEHVYGKWSSFENAATECVSWNWPE
jgi:hypothetical protein